MNDYLLLSYFPDINLSEEEYYLKPEPFDIMGGVLFDDYYHNDYGLYSNDDTNALAHANGILIKMAQDSTLDLRPSLLEDFSHYLQCLEYGLGNREDAYQFILVLLSMGLEKDAARIILDYFNRNSHPETPLDELDEQSYLDFDELYLKIADKLLFENYDVDTALQYHELASKKWKTDSSDNKWYPGEKTKTDNQAKETMIEKTNIYEIIYAGFPYVNLDVFDFKDKDKLAKRFSGLLLKGFNNDSDFIKEANSFVSKISSTLNKVDDYSRVCLLMIASLTKNCSDFILYSLSNENMKVQEQYSHEIINLITRSDNKNHRIIKDWLNNNNSETAYQTVLLFVKTIYYVNGIKRALALASFGDDTVYYTSLETFSLLFPENCSTSREDECGKLSVMNVSYMNDPNEGQILRNKIYDNGVVPKDFSERDVLPTRYVFLKCFTSMIDYLPMWQMYGDGGKGVCLVLHKNAGMINSLYRICYIRKNAEGALDILGKDNPSVDVNLIKSNLKKLKTLYNSLSRLQEQLVFDQIIDSISYLFKDSTYSYEQEKRIMYIYDSSTNNIRYTKQNPPKLYVLHNIPINIKEVILGPKFNDVSDMMPYLGHQLELMANRYNYSAPKITISNIDFK